MAKTERNFNTKLVYGPRRDSAIADNNCVCLVEGWSSPGGELARTGTEFCSFCRQHGTSHPQWRLQAMLSAIAIPPWPSCTTAPPPLTPGSSKKVGKKHLWRSATHVAALLIYYLVFRAHKWLCRVGIGVGIGVNLYSSQRHESCSGDAPILSGPWLRNSESVVVI